MSTQSPQAARYSPTAFMNRFIMLFVFDFVGTIAQHFRKDVARRISTTYNSILMFNGLSCVCVCLYKHLALPNILR